MKGLALRADFSDASAAQTRYLWPNRGDALNRSTIESFKTHLIVASITAAAIDATLCVFSDLYGISDATFETRAYRLIFFAGVVAVTILVRGVTLGCYVFALRQRHVLRFLRRGVYVSDACKFRPLVLLHLRLTGVLQVDVNAQTIYPKR